MKSAGSLEELGAQKSLESLRVVVCRPEGPGVASAAPLWWGSVGGRRAGVEGRSWLSK